jgi:hypothetical protein
VHWRKTATCASRGKPFQWLSIIKFIAHVNVYFLFSAPKGLVTGSKDAGFGSFPTSSTPPAELTSRLDKGRPATDYSHLHERSLLQAVFATPLSNRFDYPELEGPREAGGAQDGF